MRLAVDGRSLAEGRGIGNYLRHLIAGLSADTRVDLQLLAPPGIEVPGADVTRQPRLNLKRLERLEHDLRLPRELARLAPDVVWSPSQHPPTRSPAPWVQTIHDVIPLVFAHPELRRDRQRWRRLGRRLREASKVIADSQHTAEVAARELALDRSRVEVIPLGVDSGFAPAPLGRPRPAEPSILVVSSWGPHKGFAEAMAVAARVAEAGLPHRLRIVGANDEWMLDRIRSLRAASARPDRVEVVGWVDDLVAEYWDADAVVVPSRYEGFGLPLLEAMACARPVVGFANSSLPEVAGDGAVLVPDGDVEALSASLIEALTDERYAGELAARGRAQAAGFPWEATVAATLEVFRSVASD